MSADGKVLKHLFYRHIEKYNDNLDFEVILEMTNIPIFIRDEWNCFYDFSWDINGAETQGHVVNVVYREYDYQTQEWTTIQSIDWANSRLYGYFENQGE